MEPKIPSHIEILESLKRLVGIMEDPHPGLFTWAEARTKAAEKVYEELKLVLGK